MARAVRKSGVKEVPLSAVKDDLSRYLHEAETQEIVITRHEKPAGVLIGFESEEDWFEYRLDMTRASCVASNRRAIACSSSLRSWRNSSAATAMPSRRGHAG